MGAAVRDLRSATRLFCQHSHGVTQARGRIRPAVKSLVVAVQELRHAPGGDPPPLPFVNSGLGIDAACLSEARRAGVSSVCSSRMLGTQVDADHRGRRAPGVGRARHPRSGSTDVPTVTRTARSATRVTSRGVIRPGHAPRCRTAISAFRPARSTPGRP
jgi:hypothetical protein